MSDVVVSTTALFPRSPATADQDEIKKAYYDKMKICHPDIAGDDGPWAKKLCLWGEGMRLWV